MDLPTQMRLQIRRGRPLLVRLRYSLLRSGSVWQASMANSIEVSRIVHFQLTDAEGNSRFLPLNREGVSLAREVVMTSRSWTELEKRGGPLFGRVFAPFASMGRGEAFAYIQSTDTERSDGCVPYMVEAAT